MDREYEQELLERLIGGENVPLSEINNSLPQVPAFFVRKHFLRLVLYSCVVLFFVFCFLFFLFFVCIINTTQIINHRLKGVKGIDTFS